jgi:uncharacterized protein involved in exopolysaccharide biosynthesis
MKKIMSYGVFNIETQSGSLFRAYGEALIKDKHKAASEIQKKLDVLAKYGGQYMTLENWILNQSQQLSLLNTKVKEAQVDAEQSLTHVYIVDKAFRPDKKAYPQRLLIIVLSAISSLVFAVVLVFIIEAIKDFKAKEIETKAQH